MVMVEGIGHLENDGKTEVKPGGLRWLRGLLTPEARAAAAAGLRTAPNMDVARRRVAAIEKEMWVNWHWQEGVANVPKGMGVFAVRDPSIVRGMSTIGSGSTGL